MAKEISSLGQSQIVTHTIIIMFVVILILIVATTMNSIREDYDNFVGNMTSYEICSLIKSSMEKIYKPVSGNITVNRTEDMGYVILDLPPKVGNSAYRLKLSGTNIIISTSDKTYSCAVGLNATMNSSCAGGKVKLIWKYGNGTNEIKIENA